MSLTRNLANTTGKVLQLHGAVSMLAFLLPAIASLVCAQSGSFEAQTSTASKGWSEWVSEGKAFTRAGNYSAAAQAFRRAVIIAEAVSLGERKLVGIYDALASAYAEAGQYREAEYEYHRALALAERTEGRQSLEYALLVASTAVLPTQIGNRDPVVKLLREAIALNRRTGPVRELSIIRGCLAQILMDGKRSVEAESVLLDAQSGAASLRTTEPELLANLSNGLGVLRFKQGRYIESIHLYLESLRLFEDAMGYDHPSAVGPLSNLALSYLKLGRFNDAELTLRRANTVCGKTLGQDHATCGVLLEGYAVVLRKLNRKPEAKAVMLRSQQIASASQRRNGVGSTIGVTALRPKPHNDP